MTRLAPFLTPRLIGVPPSSLGVLVLPMSSPAFESLASRIFSFPFVEEAIVSLAKPFATAA
jgi:hypothetical protein